MQEQIIEWFIKCYKEKKYPVELKINCYEDFRKFRQFFYDNYRYNLQQTIDIYLTLNK